MIEYSVCLGSQSSTFEFSRFSSLRFRYRSNNLLSLLFLLLSLPSPALTTIMDHSSSTTPSLRSSTVDEKKFESLGGATSVLPVVDDNPLYTIDEKDQDEALKLAGAERQVFTQEEMDAVKKKIDRRVIPLLAAVYFVSIPSVLSLHGSMG